jgi:hypothetical protein
MILAESYSVLIKQAWSLLWKHFSWLTRQTARSRVVIHLRRTEVLSGLPSIADEVNDAARCPLFGTERTFHQRFAMSAFGGIADIAPAAGDVAF